MLLAINSGNTNASFAVYDGDKQRGRWRISTDPRRTAAGSALTRGVPALRVRCRDR